MKLLKSLSIGIAAIALSACNWSMTRCDLEPTPLQVANCPESLGELADDSFGGTTKKLIEVSGVYYRCREAIFYQQKKAKNGE